MRLLTIGDGSGEQKMSQSQTETRPSLGTIIEALHDSEINGSVSWFFDNVWGVALGNPHKGIEAEATAHRKPPNGSVRMRSAGIHAPHLPSDSPAQSASPDRYLSAT